MNLLSAPLKRLMTSFSRSTAVIPAPAREPKVPVRQSVSMDLDLDSWVDDSELRALAEDHKNNITRWVLAADLAEFFRKVDAYNAGQPEERKIKLEIHKVVHDLLAAARADGRHIAANFPGAHQVANVIGPPGVGDLRLRRGTESLPAEYDNNPETTSLTIELPSGEIQSIYFGMDHADLVFGRSADRIGNDIPLQKLPGRQP